MLKLSHKLMPAVGVIAIAIVAMLAMVGTGKLRVPAVKATNSLAAPSSQPPALSAQQRGRVRATLEALPLAFEANRGQTDPQVKYMARGNGYTVFLTPDDTVFAVHSSSSSSSASGKFATRSAAKAVRASGPEITAAVHMKLVGANPHSQIAAGRELPGHTNYFIGNDPSKWQTGVKQYAAVSYRDVYPGVNMAFHGQQRQLEFDFIVAPGAQAAPIAFGISGATKVTTDAAGNLVLSSAAGDVMLHKPVAYQQNNNAREPVDARFTLANNKVSFQLGTYDHSRELVIDPTLSFTTYLGGNAEDEVFGIAVDSSKNVYVTGEDNSTSGFPGGTEATGHGFDAYVTKLTSAGTLTYTTFVGGTATDSGLAIAADSGGAAYVTGITQSSDFPASGTAPQPTATGLGSSCTTIKNISGGACSDAYAFKLSSAGALSWATFIGGSNDDDGYAIAVDPGGNVWVAGDTFSNDFFPLTHATGVGSASFNNGVGSTPPADDGFVVEIPSTGLAPFMYATYLGGSAGDQINAIATDTSGVYVAGETASKDFPTTTGAYQTKCGSDGNCNANNGVVYYDAFVTKLVNGKYTNSGGYSTFVGGSSDDYAFALAIDSSGDAYITGETTADDTATTPAVPYPTTSGAFSTSYKSSATANGFVTELKPDASGPVFSTFLGGSTMDFGGGIALDSLKDIYVTGETLSTDFPTANALQATLNGTGSGGHSDAFISQFLPGGQLLFSSYLGGSGDENANASGSVGSIAVDSSNNVWLGGSTNSTNFPPAGTQLEASLTGTPYEGFIAEITAATNPDFALSATTPSAVAPGSSATSTVTVTSAFGYNTPVTLSCAVTGGGSPAPACSASSAFSTNPVTPTSSGATSTLTITTTGATAALNRPTGIFYAMWLPIVGLSLIGMRFSASGARRKKLLGFLLVGTVMALLFILPACGGSSGGGGGGGCTGCTPAGSYTVTVSGAAGGVTHTAAVTLTVN